MKKLLLSLALLGCAAYAQAAETFTDVLTGAENTFVYNGENTLNYDYTSTVSGITYSGYLVEDGSVIHLSSESEYTSGIVVAANKNGYVLKNISVEWNTETYDTRELNIYGKNSAYTTPGDLYNSRRKGELLGSIKKADQTSLDITGDYQYIGIIPKFKDLYFTSITLVWEKIAVAKPVITVNSNVVTLGCETDGAEIYYTEDGTAPTAESTRYEGPFEVYMPETIKAIAIKDGKESSVATQEFNMFVLEDFSMLSDITEDFLSYEFMLKCEMTVLYQDKNRRRMWLRNGNDNMLVLDFTETYEFIPGQVINGASGEFQIFNGQLEFHPTQFGEVTGTAEVPEPSLIEADEVQQNMINQYVKLLNVSIASDASNNGYTLTTAEGATVSCVNSNSIDMSVVESDNKYDVIGFVGVYSKNGDTTYRIIPTDIVEHVEHVDDFVDVLTASTFNASGSLYDGYDYESAITGVDYIGWLGEGPNNSIQLNYSMDDLAGIVVYENQNGYILKGISIEWDTNTSNGRQIEIYGKNTPYDTSADLYNYTACGKLLGTITNPDSKVMDITGEYQYIGIRAKSGDLYLSNITLVWGEIAVAKPVITVNSNVVTLSCETDGAEIYYTEDGSAPTAESTRYEGPFEVYMPETIKAIAIKDGKESSVATQEFNMFVLEDFSMLSDITEDFLSYEFMLKCEMTVLYQDKNYRRMWVRNGDNNMLVYDYTNHLFTPGQVINGLSGTFGFSSRQLEFYPTEFDEVIGTADLPEPYIIEANEVGQNMMNQYVKLLNVSIASDNSTYNNYFLTTADGNKVACYNSNNITMPVIAISKTYDVVGFVGVRRDYYGVTTYQIVPTEIVEHESPVIPELHADTPWPSNNVLEAGAQLKYVVANGFIHVRIVDTPANAPQRVAATVTEQGEAPANWEYLDAKTAVYTHPILTEGETLPKYEVVNIHNGEESAPARLELSADGTVSGIGDVTVDGNEAVEYYNLQGVRVENPAAGLYIRRQGNTFTKVIVK